ncbi:C-type lectin domain family 4 member F [Orchesella cincta]|uniref:C-type lectin domain family 4 member F n=1 Tax=Orchesella cincta TaxID=48709 RepID=A0A1D2MCV2_ORCCI|nr:C-type lectin domain family 4 member F [Orchesella cincta]
MKSLVVIFGIILQILFVVSESAIDLSVTEKLPNYKPGEQKQTLFYLGIINNKHLFADNELRSWHEARDYCESLGMELAVINTDTEVAFLMDNYHGTEFSLHHWIAPVGLRNIPWRNMIDGTDICNAFYAGVNDDEFRIGLCEWGWRTLCQTSE